MQTCLGGGARRIASMAFPTLLSLRGSTLADLRLRLAERLFSHAGRMYMQDNLRSTCNGRRHTSTCFVRSTQHRVTPLQPPRVRTRARRSRMNRLASRGGGRGGGHLVACGGAQ